MGIMENVIKIAELISTDVRSRSNAKIIRDKLKQNHGRTVLDFNGVVFISRSFTDELCSILEQPQNSNVERINEANNIKIMIDTVTESRRVNKRMRPKESSKIESFSDMESLSKYLLTT